MSVILYNYRYRGPYEYDKFIYNVLQISNETDIIEAKFKDISQQQLQLVLSELNQLLDTLTGTSSNLHKLHLYSLQFEERE